MGAAVVPKARRITTNFSKGELSPRIEGRPDLSAYFEGAREITNYLLLRQGGLERRSGTRFVAEVKDATKDTILLPFEFSVDDTYQIETGDGYYRFFKNGPTGSRIEVATVPVEITSPYIEAQLRNIHFTQSADVLFQFHADVAQRKLSRISDTSWVLSTTKFNPPASFEADTILTDPTWPLILMYSATTGTGVRFRAADNSLDAVPDAAIFLAGDVGRQIIIGAGRATITALIDQYQVTADILDDFDSTPISAGPGVLTSVGTAVTTTLNHGVTPGQFISVASGAQFNEAQKVIATPTLNTLTIEYAFSLDQNGVDWKKHIPIAQGGWALRGSPQTTLDPDKKEPVGGQVTLVAGADTFRTTNRGTDVGKFIFIYGGLIKITQYVSLTEVKGEILTVLADTTSADPPPASAGAWTLEEVSWSAARGYPRTGEFFQGRLGQAATAAQPTTWWLSASDDYDNYAVGVNADNAIEYTIASRQVNRIEWLSDSTDFFLGTAGAEFRAVGDRQGEPLGGEHIPLVERLTTHGCAPIQSMTLDRRILFIDRSRRKILTISFSFEQDAFDAIELTAPSEHITEGGVRLGLIGHRRRVDPQLFFVREDGVLPVLTYFPSEKVIGFSRLTTQGTFECVSVSPHPQGLSDRVWTIVNRTINGQTKRYIEYFDDAAPELSGRAWQNLQTDCAKVYSGGPTTIITGADHLEGETVDVIADGSFIGTRVVTGGQFTLDEPASIVEYGLHYDSKVETMRPAVEGSVIEGLPRSWDDVSVRLLKTIGGKINGEWLTYAPSDLDTLGLFTGDRLIVGQGWDTEGRITVEQTQPYPMTVLAVYGTLSVGDHA